MGSIQSKRCLARSSLFFPKGNVVTVTTDQQHSDRMRELIDFAASSFHTCHPSPFGAAIYDQQSGDLLSQAFDTVMKESDPTNHGEINAIRLATRKLGRLSLRGSILYSTCEPCPMCMSACIWAEVDTVVYGASTMEDADRYWPQSSDMPPSRLLDHMLIEPMCTLVPHVERALCQELFDRCDVARKQLSLQLPPHR